MLESSLPSDAIFSFSTVFNSGASNSGTSSLTSKFGNGVFKGVWELFGTMDGEVMKTLKTLIYQSINIFRYYLE
jgi:hypothetical protein